MAEPTIEIVPGTDKAPSLPDAVPLEIKVQPSDAIYGPAAPLKPEPPVKNVEPAKVKAQAPAQSSVQVQVQARAPAQKAEGPSFFARLMGNVGRTLAVACLCGLAWAAGTYYSAGHLPLDLAKASPASEVPQAPDQMLSAVQQMRNEIHALEVSVDGKDAAQDSSVQNTQNQDSQKQQLDSMRATTGAITDLAGKVDKLESEVSTKLSQIDDRLTGLEQKISASHAAAASRTQLPHRHVHVHDAFDPSQDPAAPGSPHELGSH